MVDNSISLFESMSNELLMELFEYYDLYSLFYSFLSLNSRIDNILYNCQVYFDVDYVESSDFIDFIAHILPKINPKNIRSLSGSKSHQITTLIYDKSIYYFNYIRSLRLSNVETSVMKYLVSRIHFSRLERVIYKKCERDYTWSPFQHFLISNRYHFLRTYKDLRGQIEKVTSNLLIKHVTFDQSSPCYFLNFLNQSPNLVYIKTSLIFYHEYPEPIFLSPIPCYHALKHLDLDCCAHVYMKPIIYLFECVPRICHLKLRINFLYEPEYVQPSLWEMLLSKYLIQLKQLSLFVFTCIHNSSTHAILNLLVDKEKINEEIEKSHYWSSHQWKTTFNCDGPTQYNTYSARFIVN